MSREKASSRFEKPRYVQKNRARKENLNLQFMSYTHFMAIFDVVLKNSRPFVHLTVEYVFESKSRTTFFSLLVCYVRKVQVGQHTTFTQQNTFTSIREEGKKRKAFRSLTYRQAMMVLRHLYKRNFP